MKIVVADGGSSDGTQQIVEANRRANPRVALLHNPKKIQSAAINLAIEKFGDGYVSFIRIDAHGDYPVGYCERLVEEAIMTGADSVVVAMATEGFGPSRRRPPSPRIPGSAMGAPSIGKAPRATGPITAITP